MAGKQNNGIFPTAYQGGIEFMAVALLDGKVCGFGHINHNGVVGLLYVAPEARFMGASAAMLKWLESEAQCRGATTVSLESSLTAKRFYEARGYVQSGAPNPGFGITRAWPMAKRLGPTP